MADEHDHDDRDDGAADATVAEIEMLLADLDVDELELTRPPDAVWDGIAGALSGEMVSETPIVAVDTDDDDDDDDADDSARVVVLDDGRRRRNLNLIMAAAAALIVFAVAAAVFLRDDDSVEVVATAELAFDPATFDPLGAGTSATARLVEVDGHYEIEIDRALLPSDLGDDALELWLIETDDDGRIVDVASVAMLADELPATYRVPATIDTTTHRIVDISIEPDDGDANHSGRSILRGTLQA